MTDAGILALCAGCGKLRIINQRGYCVTSANEYRSISVVSEADEMVAGEVLLSVGTRQLTEEELCEKNS